MDKEEIPESTAPDAEQSNLTAEDVKQKQAETDTEVAVQNLGDAQTDDQNQTNCNSNIDELIEDELHNLRLDSASGNAQTFNIIPAASFGHSVKNLHRGVPTGRPGRGRARGLTLQNVRYSEEQIEECPCCFMANHEVENCARYSVISVIERYAVVKASSICFH